MTFTAGIGASLTTFAPNTVAHASDVNANYTNINSGGVSNDGNKIKTDGGGNVDFNGQLSTGGTVAFDCSGFDTVVATRGGGNIIHLNVATNTIATIGTTGLGLQTGNVSAPSVLTCGVSFGVKNASGGKLFEAKSDGKFIIGGTQYQTSQSSISNTTSQSFDSFDVAEVANADAAYNGGTVVCPNDNGLYTRCTHDNCPCAVIVSSSPGVLLGIFDEETEQATIPLALAGRVQAKTNDASIAVRDFLCSAGDGTVRAMRAGEAGFTLGYALHATNSDGITGLFLRSMYCAAPT